MAAGKRKLQHHRRRRYVVSLEVVGGRCWGPVEIPVRATSKLEAERLAKSGFRGEPVVLNVRRS